MATALTPHPCNVTGVLPCTGSACSNLCDPDGCDFNSYRQGDTTFYGANKTVDTSKVFTVVTQFIETSGALSEIRRYYVQDGVVIPNSYSTKTGVTGYNSITEDYCDAQKAAFNDTTSFQDHGGLAQMGRAFENGMALVMSIWDDHEAGMLWLDSAYPTDVPASNPGISRGPCSATSGDPQTVESQSAGASVSFSNIKVGPIGSTY